MVKVNSDGKKELDKAQEQFDNFDKQVKDLTMEHMNAAPKVDLEPQTKIAQRDLEKSKDLYLKPARIISSKEKFNERFRDKYEFDNQYVQFIAENKEIIGETIEMWTKPYPGIAAMFWQIPTNKPVFAPRYVAEQLTKCRYHRLRMEDRPTGMSGEGTYYGTIVVDNTINRLDAFPVSTKKSIFMAA